MRQNIDRTIEDCNIIQLQKMKNMAGFVQNKMLKNQKLDNFNLNL